MIKRALATLGICAALAGSSYSNINHTQFQDPVKPRQSLEHRISISQKPIDAVPQLSLSVDDILTRIIENHPDPKIKDNIAYEFPAFQRVLQARPHIEAIAKDYKHVEPYSLLGMVKQESQGRLGVQSSRSGAIGPFQMLYAGSYGFIYDLMFSETLQVTDPKTGRKQTVPDYANINRRKNYEPQLKRMKDYLSAHNILVAPNSSTSYQQAKQQTWNNLKNHFEKIKSFDDIHPHQDFERYHFGWEAGIIYKDYLNSEVKRNFESAGIRYTPEIGLAAYNAGPTRIRNLKGKIPNNGETPHYVDMVNLYAQVFERIDGVKEAMHDINKHITALNNAKQRFAQRD